MTDLRIKAEVSNLTKVELENLESIIDDLINPTSKILKEKFKEIINYNKEIIIKKNLKFEEFYDDLSKKKVSPENKSNINKQLKQYQTNEIFKISIDSNFKILKEKKISLIDLYRIFIKDYLPVISEEIGSFSSIKIYDFFQEAESKDLFIDELFADVNIKNKFKNWVKPKELEDELIRQKDIKEKKSKYSQNIQKLLKNIVLKPDNIQILSSLSTLKSHDIYNKIYQFINNVNIKYIPYTDDIYTPSLFYMVINYRIRKTGNYKEVIIYLEQNTNWGVVSLVNSSNFSSQFYKLLDTRYDIKYEDKNNIDFRPSSNNNTKNIFETEINNIYKKIDNFINQDKNISSFQIMKDINSLKVNFPKTNYGYKLLKNIVNYISIIRKLQANRDKLENTNYIIGEILNNKINKKTNKILELILLKNDKYSDVDITKLRMGVIQKINDKALCDLFENLQWTKKHDIIISLTEIGNSQKMLTVLFNEIDSSKKLSFKDMKYEYNEKILKKIKKGEKIAYLS